MTGEAEIWRPEAVTRLTLVDGRVVLVVGESGSGKSRLLEQALVERSEPFGISELRRSDAVQMHLQRALAEVLRRHLEAGADVAEVRDQLREALLRLGGRYTRAAVSAVTRRVLDVLTRGVAEEIKQAFSDLAEELAAGTPARVLERLQETSDDSPLEQMLEFARDVSTIVGGPIALGLDRGEYLSDPDVDLLLDLAEEPQDTVMVFVAIRSDHSRGRQVLERLEADAPQLPSELLLPLDQDRVQRIAPQLPPGAPEQLVELSGGNARQVADALHLPEVRWAEPRLALALAEELSVGDRTHARVLSVLSSAPSSGTIERLLGLDEEGWTALSARLAAAGIIDSSRWIHEARRAELIPDEPPEQAVLAMRALSALAPDLIDDEDGLGQVLELAHMAAPMLSSTNAAVLNAGLGVIGVVAGWFELQSMEREQPILARTVALYAHEQWAAPLLDAAGWERASATGLLSLEKNAAGQILLPRPHIDDVGLALLRARLLNELGRVPVPYLAEMVLIFGLDDALVGRPSSGPRAGVSAPSDLLFDEASLRDGREDVPTLMITAKFRGVPLGFAVRCHSDDELRSTHEQLRARRREVFGKALVITDVVSGPPHAQPSERFMEAADLAGIDLDKLPSVDGGAGRSLAESRSQMLDALRDRLSPEERLTAALDLPIAIGVVEEAGKRLTVEFRGTRHGAVDISSAAPTLGGSPLLALRKVDDLITSFSEHVGASSFELFSGRAEHPLSWAVNRAAEGMRHVNLRLPRVVLDLDDPALTARLTLGFARLVSDARLLHHLVGEREQVTLPSGLVLVLPATAASAMEKQGERDGLAFWTTGPANSVVEIQRRDDLDFYGYDKWDDVVRAAHLGERRVIRGNFSSAKRLIASLLGYEEDDIELLATAH